MIRMLELGWIGLCLLSTQLAAQKVSVTLQPQTDTVMQGTVLQLRYTFENVQAKDFTLPEIVGLVPVSGPSTQSQMSIMNGKRSSSQSYAYQVVADQAGLAYVPSYELTHEDETLNSEPVQLFVEADPTYIPLAERRARDPEAPRPKRPRVRM